MSFFSGYDEGGVHDRMDSNLSEITNSIFMIVVGSSMFFLSLFSILPNDLFTTALFFDGLGLQAVFNESAKWFQSISAIPAVTKEAFSFSLATLLIQLYTGYRYAFAEDWSREGFWTSIRNRDFSSISGHKTRWFVMYWLAALLDTWTDAQYRSYFGAPELVFEASIVSFVFYNLASEFFIVVGSKTAFVYALNLFSSRPSRDNNKRSHRPSSPERAPAPRSPAPIPPPRAENGRRRKPHGSPKRR